jgi:hypothetical protein
MVQRNIPSSLPPLPPATAHPWSGEVVDAHRGLTSAFLSSRRALNLDESDPVRLGHHVKQAETFMVSIVDTLSSQRDNPLPTVYIQGVRDAVTSLLAGLQTAMAHATSAYALSHHSSGNAADEILAVSGRGSHRSRQSLLRRAEAEAGPAKSSPKPSSKRYSGQGETSASQNLPQPLAFIGIRSKPI